MRTKICENPNQLIPTAEAADYVGLSEAWFRCGRYTSNPDLPTHYQIGRKILYKREDLDAWLEKHRVVQKAA